MGMYTELIFGASLKEDTPTQVIMILEHMTKEDFSGEPLPKEVLPKHPFFSIDGWQWLFQCSSYYFGVCDSSTVFKKCRSGRNYILSTRSSIKNYEGEIEAFLNWIKPYCQQGSGERHMIAIVTYEEGMPVLHYLKEEASEQDLEEDY